jgi:hypothetical protein
VCVGAFFDVALVNLYRNGADYVSVHNDNDALDTPVASWSFGAGREFVVYPFDAKPLVANIVHTVLLTNCSLFVMNAGFQRKYKHAVPKRSANKYPSPRLNVTLRQHNAELCSVGAELVSFGFIMPVAVLILSFMFFNPNHTVSYWLCVVCLCVRWLCHGQYRCLRRWTVSSTISW